MGKRGPSKTPTTLRLLRGAPESSVNPREPIAVDVLPVFPDGEPEDIREVWDYTVAHLDRMGIASAADRDSLVCYCWAVINHRNASEVIANSPVLVKGLHGGLVKNPALQVQRDAAVTIRAFAQEFGLTPSARASIETGGAGEDGANPFDRKTYGS